MKIRRGQLVLWGVAALVLGERGQPAFARDPFAFVAEDHGVAVEGDAQLVRTVVRRAR